MPMRALGRWLPVVAWSAVILLASSDAFSTSNTQSWFRSLLDRDLPYLLHIAARKVGHLLAYAILGALAFRASRVDFRTPAFAAMVVAAIVALTDEGHQSVTTMRSGSPWDVLIDLAGAWIAVWWNGAAPRSS